MQSQVQLLVGERDQVRSTNDLLSGLKAQQTAFEEARHSLATLRQFREEMASRMPEGDRGPRLGREARHAATRPSCTIAI